MVDVMDKQSHMHIAQGLGAATSALLAKDSLTLTSVSH